MLNFLLGPFLLVSLSVVCDSHPRTTGGYTLTVLHVNELWQYEESLGKSRPCDAIAEASRVCFGGYPRLVHAISEVRRFSPNTIVFSLGNNFFGSVLFFVHGYRITSEFTRLMAPDVIGLGWWDLNLGVNETNAYIESLNGIPVVLTNIRDQHAEQNKSRTARFMPSAVISRGEKKIGVLSFINPTSDYEQYDYEVLPLISSLGSECDRLRNEQHVNLVFAMGFANFDDIKLLGTHVQCIDVIIVGNQKALFYNMYPEVRGFTPVSRYPFILVRGDKSLVILGSCPLAFYMGYAVLHMDVSDQIVSATGNPLYMGNERTEDPAARQLLTRFQENAEVRALKERNFGATQLNIEAKNCGRGECPVANLLTQAIFEYTASVFTPEALKKNTGKNDKNKNGTSLFPAGYAWTVAPIVFIDFGCIFTGLYHYHTMNITKADIVSMYSVNRNLVYLQMTGRQLLNTMEAAVRRLDDSKANAYEYLHFAGVKIVYDLRLPAFSRVINVEVLCSQCGVPEYQPLNVATNYGVVTTDHLLRGGSSHDELLADDRPEEKLGKGTFEVVEWYLDHHRSAFIEITDWVRFYFSREQADSMIVTNINLNG